MSAKITFNELDLTSLGAVTWGRSHAFERRSDGAITKISTNHRLSLQIEESSFADNEAQLGRVLSSLASGHGLLTVEDENGTQLVHEYANVSGHDVPDEWRQYLGTCTINLSIDRQVDATTVVFTPAGGLPIILPGVTNWGEGQTVERYEDRDNRKNLTGAIRAAGEYIPEGSEAEKRLLVDAFRLASQGLVGTKGTIVFGASQYDARIDAYKVDGELRAAWDFTASQRKFPIEGRAEAEFDVQTSEGEDSAKRIIVVSGAIRAETELIAHAKLALILEEYQSGRVLLDREVTDARVDGSDGRAWIRVRFSLRFEERIDSKLRYTLKVSTTENVERADKAIVYEGSVTASTLEAAIAKARELGAGKYRSMVRSAETSYFDGRNTEEFNRVDFSYEYVTKSEWVYAEVNGAINNEPFGDSRESITGFVAAKDKATASLFAQQFRLSGRVMRESSESYVDRHFKLSDTEQAHGRYEFKFVYYLQKTAVSIGYSREDVEEASGDRSITYSGVAWGPTEAACLTLINATAVVENGKVTQRRTVPVYEKQGEGNAVFLSVSFTCRFAVPASQGYLSAELSIARTYSVPKVSAIFIPFGVPYMQSNLGLLPGRVVVRGYVRAETKDKAITWARAQMALATNGGGYAEQPEENEVPEYIAGDPGSVRGYRIEFSYAAIHKNLSM